MRIAKAGSVALVALLLSACNSDDDTVTPVPPSPPPPPTVTGAAGFWNGSTSANRELRGAILDNGQMWMFYGGVGAPGSIAGFLQGTGSETATTYTSRDTLDFNLEGPSRQSATFTATYAAKSTLNGSVNYPTTTTTTISATGVISGSSTGGCRFTGTTTPRTAGNVYDYSITFGGAPCDLQNQTLRGVATLDAAGRTLIAAARQLIAAGAASVDVAVTHPLFVGDALDALRAVGVRRIWSGDGIPHPTNAIRLAPLIASALTG